MQPRSIITLAALALVAAVAIPTSAAKPTLTHQVDVFIKQTTCRLQKTSVSRRNTTILFHFINNGTTAHGIIVRNRVKSKLVLAGREGDLYMKFPGPGHYPFACTAGSYNHPRIFGRTTFTIRKT